MLTVWLLVGLPAAYAMGNYTDTALSDAGKILGDGKIVVLEPEKWIDKPLPLLDYIDIGDRLKEGKWIVVFYYHNCAKCHAMLPQYRRLSRDLTENGEAMHLALIEAPPYGIDERALARSRRAWQARTPLTPHYSCTPLRISRKRPFFEPSFNRSIKIQGGDDRLTSESGVMLLREADHCLGLTASLASQLHDSRQQHLVRYRMPELLRERIYSMAQGYRAQDDVDRLAHDPALRMATWDRPGGQVVEERSASQPTHSRSVAIQVFLEVRAIHW